MDLNHLSATQQQKLVTTLFSYLGFFQKDGRISDWERLNDFRACKNEFARLLLAAWLDRLAILHRIGLGWRGSSTAFHLMDCTTFNDCLSRYIASEPVVDCKSYHVDQADLIFVSPQIGRYRANLVMGRFELDYIGDDHDPITKKQQPVAVMCNEYLKAAMTEEEHRIAHFEDDAIRVHGFKLIRFTAEEVIADAAACARRIDEMFIPTWCHHKQGESSHPYDALMRKVLSEP
jgi:hypothetical protein